MLQSGVTTARRRVLLQIICAATAAAALVGPANAGATTLGTLADQVDCGDVTGNGVCRTGYWDLTGSQAYARFTTVNGNGVLHAARLYYNGGSGSQDRTYWLDGTAQYVRSACFSGLPDPVAAVGWNESTSPHHFTVELFIGCY
jgi:hypothetical protein